MMKAQNLKFKDLITKHNTSEAIVKGYEGAIVQLFKQYFKDKVLANPDSFLFMLDEADKMDFLKYCAKRRMCKRYAFVFIVVNLRPGVSISEIQKPLNRALRKKWITNCIFNYEQRSRTFKDMGKGIHLNILVELSKTKNPWQCKGEFYNTFKNYVGHNKHVVSRYSNDSTNFIKYILGMKKHPSKKTTLDIDRRWRYETGLKDYYVRMTDKTLDISDFGRKDFEYSDGCLLNQLADLIRHLFGIMTKSSVPKGSIFIPTKSK